MTGASYMYKYRPQASAVFLWGELEVMGLVAIIRLKDWICKTVAKFLLIYLKQKIQRVGLLMG